MTSQGIYAQGQWSLRRLATVSFAAMYANDLLLTCMVVFESHYNGVAAGLFDVMGWMTGIVCSALALDSIFKNGWKSRRSLVVIGAITAANFLGTLSGVWLSRILG